MFLDLGIPPLALQQAKQLCQMQFRYIYGAPSIMQALLYGFRVANMMASPKDSMEAWNTAYNGHMQIWTWGIVSLTCSSTSVGLNRCYQTQGEDIRTCTEGPG